MELHLRAVSARNLLDKQTFGRQDPYCKIQVGHRTFRTRVHDNGHKTPHWNEKFVFEVVDPQLDQVHLQVKDKNLTVSVLIGELRLPVHLFTHGNVVDQWFPLNNHNKYAGEINLRVQLCGYGQKSDDKSKTAAGAYATPAPMAYPVAQQPADPLPPQQQQAYPYPQQQPVYGAAPMAQPMATYAAPAPAVVMQPAPMMMGQPMMMAPAATTVVYNRPNSHYDNGYYGHHGHYGHHHRRHSGGDVAMGVGAGLLGGFVLGGLLD